MGAELWVNLHTHQIDFMGEKSSFVASYHPPNDLDVVVQQNN